MAIIRKSSMDNLLSQLDASYQQLNKTLRGEKANPNLYNRYSADPDEYAREFVEIDLRQARIEMKRFRAVLDELVDLKEHVAAPLNDGR